MFMKLVIKDYLKYFNKNPYQQQFNYVGGREQVQKSFNQYMNKYNKLYQKSQQRNKLIYFPHKKMKI